jgi:Myo-inositol oxygenase
MDAPRSSGSPLLPKPVDQFRDYAHAKPRVEEFYALNHANQTLDFVLDKKREYLPRTRKTMTVWESLDYLNTLVDDSWLLAPGRDPRCGIRDPKSWKPFDSRATTARSGQAGSWKLQFNINGFAAFGCAPL